MTHSPQTSTRLPRPGSGRLISFFGHDEYDSTIQKRIDAFQRHGSRVAAFVFRRAGRQVPLAPRYQSIRLGVTNDLDYRRRILSLASAFPRILRQASTLRNSDAIYARNLDMLGLAALAKLATGSRAPLVYEALDIRGIFVGDRVINRLFRFAERRLLSMIDLLVVSSPDYMTRYFKPVQSYAGPFRLLENKLAEPSGETPPHDLPEIGAGPPWVIGWFGILRCRRTLSILTAVAEQLGSKAEIHIRGICSEKDVTTSEIRDLCQRQRNVHFFGPYSNPADLPLIYGRVHLTWASDFLDPEANSPWSLTNRFYEGAAHGSVLLACNGTATGDRVELHGLGWALPEPLERSVPAFLSVLDPQAYLSMRRNVQTAPRHLFYDVGDTAGLLDQLDAIRPDRRAIPSMAGPAATDGERGGI